MFGSEVIEKVKPTLDKITNFIIGSQETKSENEINVFGDNFRKRSNKEVETYKVSKKVWVNGQEFNIIASSNEELNQRVSQINRKNNKEESLESSNILLFSGLYTEQREIDENEWFSKRDVWVDEYCPA